MRRLCFLVFALVSTLLAVGSSGCQVAEQPPSPTKRKPLKIAHALGERRVPYRSQAPITLDPAALEAALALGIPPVGSTGSGPDGGFAAYLGRVPAGVTQLGRPDRVDTTQVQKLNPDVIVGNKRYQGRIFKRLDRFAPTVMSGVALSEWKADFRFFGESLGRGDQAERLLVDYDRRVARARRALKAGRSAKPPSQLSKELAPEFVADVLEDVGLPQDFVNGQGRGGGILAARALLSALIPPTR